MEDACISPNESGGEADKDRLIEELRQAVKARDLQRDPRFALHSASVDPPGWRGDAKRSMRPMVAMSVAAVVTSMPGIVISRLISWLPAHAWRGARRRR